MMLTNLADILRGAGLRVIEQPGWKTRGHGPMGKVEGVLWHHTAGARSGNYPSLAVVERGRPGLAGPLANLGLARDGTWIVIAAGVAWHAGNGVYPGVPRNGGNRHLIGVEAENTGTGEPWSPAQLDSYRRGTAALLRAFGLGSERAIGHKEYATPRGRKIDPAGLDMNAERAHVAKYMTNPPAGGEDLIIMALNDEFTDWAGNKQTGYSWAMNVDKRVWAIEQAILGLQKSRIPGDENQTNAANLWFDAGSWTNQTLGRVVALEERVNEVNDKLDRVLAGMEK
ncbi:N-acetylmuramoyl-L-alanine amidase [Saccharopolyspora indica]|uniref:peptidoglycan recognition protein family protein n=1 Tax=Saccharopolyspora indica TaxID=1229659 RepID=UPI0022EAEF20|nr:N-acetylmuramoyl-L-alanine amidase [Saccharopolyspora indica]MDA3643771.1 N-acetylmuramoyl-L-alanine amidase [Saccharopolyspora indica]